MNPVVSFINMKGGVGKTTLCIGIASYLSQYLNKKVLVIDIDSQFNATQSLFGFHSSAEFYLNEILEKELTVRKIFSVKTKVAEDRADASADDIIFPLTENLHIIPGDINIIFDSSKDTVRVRKLKSFIRKENLREKYDFILIDSPPTISVYTEAALIASDYYLVPVKIDYYSALGAKNLINVISDMSEEHDHTIKNIGFIYTFVKNFDAPKVQNIRNYFEDQEAFDKMCFFKSRASHKDIYSSGKKGNIATEYLKTKADIAKITEEFVQRINDLSF